LIVWKLRERVPPKGKVGVLEGGRGAGVELEMHIGNIAWREQVVHHVALSGISEKNKIFLKVFDKIYKKQS
jgi:hypothetical protein